jgi:imidazolonepropionase
MPVRRLVLNCGQLLTMTGPDRPRAGAEMGKLGLIRDGAVLVEDGRIAAAGLRELVQRDERAAKAQIIDAGGRVVLPGFVDSHSHPVFAAPRLDDFERRLKGETYAQIAAAGGGILSTVNGVRGASQASLADGLARRAALFLESGTTTLEAKSGYGLDLDAEVKMLRAIKDAAERTALELVPTFIGAHAVPPELRAQKGGRAEYVRRVCEEMIPAVAEQKLARFVDVFCEDGFFSLEDTDKIFHAAKARGLGLKIHAEQLSRAGSVPKAVAAGAISLDHLDCCDASDISALAGAAGVACLVPGSNYFLGKPYPPARRLIDGGAAVALATDFNPGTCPCWDMRAIVSIACTQMKLSPAEALVAATVNGAYALGLGRTHGALEPGKQADLVCYDAEDYRELAYYFGAPQVAWTLKKGHVVFDREGTAL